MLRKDSASAAYSGAQLNLNRDYARCFIAFGSFGAACDSLQLKAFATAPHFGLFAGVLSHNG